MVTGIQSHPITFANVEWMFLLWPDKPDFPPVGNSYPTFTPNANVTSYVKQSLMSLLPPQQIFPFWLFN